MNRKVCSTHLLLVLTAAGVLSSSAAFGQQVLFSNLQNPPDPSNGISSGAGALAVPFTTPSGTFTLTDAKLNVGITGTCNPNTCTHVLNAWIASDSGGSPGALIGQVGVNVPVPTGPGVVTVNAVSTPIVLTGGTIYWLVLTRNPSSFNNFTWNAGGSTSVAVFATSSNDGTSGWSSFVTTTLQFQIDGTVGGSSPPPPGTPVPPSLLLIITGMVGAGLYLMRSKFARAK